jgi:hypothetical protein
LQAADAEVGRVLEETGVHAYVCLPWVITWWSHDSKDLGRCARMYDAFLAAPPVFPLYVAAAMIARARTELLALEERDFASVHTFLARLAAREDLPVEELIVEARRLLRKRPPKSLVKAGGSPALAEAVRLGEVHALREPPGKAQARFLAAEMRRVFLVVGGWVGVGSPEVESEPILTTCVRLAPPSRRVAQQMG